MSGAVVPSGSPNKVLPPVRRNRRITLRMRAQIRVKQLSERLGVLAEELESEKQVPSLYIRAYKPHPAYADHRTHPCFSGSQRCSEQ